MSFFTPTLPSLPPHLCSFTRQQIDGGRWNVNHPARIDERGEQITLRSEILAAFPGWHFMIFARNSFLDIRSDVACSDPLLLADVVAKHQSNYGMPTTKLDRVKSDTLNLLSEEMRDFIEFYYPAFRQRTLSEIRADARFQGNQTALDYVQQVVDWINSCINTYYGAQLAILDSSVDTVEAVNGILIDYEPLKASEPGVTIAQARILLAS